jgi:hypothetical protein
MAWKDWNPEMPVVFGVRNGEITPEGRGFQEFESLEHARRTFADVDPEVNGQRFTSAIAGETNEGRPRIRFIAHSKRN